MSILFCRLAYFMYHNNNHRKVQVAVITGSSKGIGKAIATEFAKAGYSVVINARDEGELKQASEDISQSTEGKNKVVYVPGDISQEQISESLIQEAINTFGRIDGTSKQCRYRRKTKEESMN